MQLDVHQADNHLFESILIIVKLTPLLMIVYFIPLSNWLIQGLSSRMENRRVFHLRRVNEPIQPTLIIMCVEGSY